jgi:hypothetical protein
VGEPSYSNKEEAMKYQQLSQEERRAQIKFNRLFTKAVDNFRQDALSRPDYDPANLFIYSAMVARGLIRMLEAVEAEFGEKGQQVATRALVEVGRELVGEGIEGVEWPQDMKPVDMASIFATWLNEVLYASVEIPSIDSEGECSFHIHWCPLQDIYSPLDCRIQRYFVEGMFDAAPELIKNNIQHAFQYGIPSGHPTCHFHLWQKKEGEEEKTWQSYTQLINSKALEKKRKG